MLEDLRTASVGGRTIRYLAGGDPAGAAGTLLLLHAFPLGVGMWRSQLEAFAGWRVVAPAFPGFDGTPPTDDPTVDAFAAHGLAALDALGISAAVFCGLSMGGYVSLAAWRTAPERVAGLVLADTRAGADTPEARAARGSMRERLGQLEQSGVAEEMLPRLLGAGTPSARPEVVERVRDLIDRQTLAGIDGAIQVIMSRPDSTPTLPTVTVPALAVVGEDDVLTPPAEAELIQAGIPGAALARIAGAGHLTNLEQPDAFNRAVGRFLKGVRAG